MPLMTFSKVRAEGMPPLTPASPDRREAFSLSPKEDWLRRKSWSDTYDGRLYVKESRPIVTGALKRVAG